MTDADIDTIELESYLAEELDTGVIETAVLHDGLNLSIAISTEEAERAYVLRRPNKLRHTSLFNDLQTEYGLLQRLNDTGIPTPSPILFCDDESLIGDPFFVTTYLDGAAIRLGADLPERFRNDGARRRVATRLVDTLADIHSLDAERFEGICERRTPQEQVARTTERLDEATSVTGHDLPTLRSVGDWLQRNAPSASATTLVHGDFRPSNVLFAETDQPEVSGVLDWETAFLGDPLTELGYLLLRWRDDGDPTLSIDELEAKYPNEDTIAEVKAANENGLSPFTARPGSPSRRKLVARYEERTARPFANERFYRAHAAFGLATVWEDLHRHRTEAGTASNAKPVWVEYLAMVAHSIASGKFQL
ncbi:phosphotransferase family protein [Halococcus sp. PRR34]|uniref:phosphotransferase family protein n=1 Tax=Halococcus sp. PRR34 TaxID=3020830 RepID=UPI00235EDA1C|nr:phosphotransferase family protein [Halococcus sp. PRR34]